MPASQRSGEPSQKSYPLHANAEYTIALIDISNHPGAIYGLGIVAYRQGRVDDALAKLNRVIQIDAERFPKPFLARGGIRGERRL